MVTINHVNRNIKGYAIYVTLLLSLLSFSGFGNVQESRSADATKIELHERAEKVTKRTVRYQEITPVYHQFSFDFTHQTFYFSELVTVLLKQRNQLHHFTDYRSGIHANLGQSHPQSTDPDFIKA